MEILFPPYMSASESHTAPSLTQSASCYSKLHGSRRLETQRGVAKIIGITTVNNNIALNL